MRTNSELQLHRKYQRDSKRRDIDFALPFQSFCRLIRLNCHYCAAEPAGVWKNGKKNRSYSLLYNGIDRKDNKRGYFPRNCTPACKRCNYAKAKLTKKDFLTMVEQIYKNHYELPPLSR